MKKIFSILLTLVILLSACSAQNPPVNSTEEPATPEIVTAASSSAVFSEPPAPADDTVLEDNHSASDKLIYETFLALHEKALTVMCWYFGDTSGNLEVESGDTANTENRYRKVVTFQTIEELKAATEEAYTIDFCNAFFYDHAFTDTSETNTPMYKEIDGILYRNIDKGGFGWPYAQTGDYTVTFQNENIIVLLVKINVVDHDKWFTFVMKNDGVIWKFDKWYDYTPYKEYEKELPPYQKYDGGIAPAVSAWFCGQNWNDPNELDVNSFIVFYADRFLHEKRIEDYNLEDGYAVPADEVLENLSKCFVGLQKETLTKVNDEKYASGYYDEATDRFVFYLSRDSATFVICSEESSQEKTVLTVLVIAKNDKASYWGKLTVDNTPDGLRYLSNKYTDIPEE